jgi:hypothetical protein
VHSEQPLNTIWLPPDKLRYCTFVRPFEVDGWRRTVAGRDDSNDCRQRLQRPICVCYGVMGYSMWVILAGEEVDAYQ